MNLNIIKYNVCRLLYWPNLTDNSLMGTRLSNNSKFIGMYFNESGGNDFWDNSTTVDCVIKGLFKYFKAISLILFKEINK